MDEIQAAAAAPAIVCDNGSGSLKLGFAGEDAPRAVVPLVVGRPRARKFCNMSSNNIGEDKAQAHQQQQQREEDGDFYIGEEAESKRGVLRLSWPVHRGVVADWSDMERVWRHTWQTELRVDPAEHPVLLTEAPLNPRSNRERMVEAVFEELGAPAAYVAMQAVLALYASGRTTGAVLDSGEGVSHVVPVYEGYALPHAVQRIDVAGADVTDALARLLLRRGYGFLVAPAQRPLVRRIKESLCRVAAAAAAAGNQAAAASGDAEEGDAEYVLPDGQVISVGSERFESAEVLFTPALMGMEAPGLPEALQRCIGKCDVDLRRELYGNIVLSGGCTLLPGLPERVAAEMAELSPPSVRVRVVAPPERRYSVWMGGSILASLDSFQNMWISRHDFYEFGPSIVHRKCL